MYVISHFPSIVLKYVRWMERKDLWGSFVINITSQSGEMYYLIGPLIPTSTNLDILEDLAWMMSQQSELQSR